MHERLIEVIMYLLKEFKSNRTNENYHTLSQELSARGYSNVEINFALNWIFNNLSQKQGKIDQDIEYSSRANRLLHQLERIILTPEAYGYLLQMHQLGLLNDAEFEEVIDGAILEASPVIDIDDIKRIAALVVFGGDPEKKGAWEGFLFPFGSNTIQ